MQKLRTQKKIKLLIINNLNRLRKFILVKIAGIIYSKYLLVLIFL